MLICYYTHLDGYNKRASRLSTMAGLDRARQVVEAKKDSSLRSE